MQDLNNYNVLIVPGVGGSGAEHWQTFWEDAFPQFQRVQQADWDRPVYTQWAARLSDAVTQSTRPVVIVAHSLGTSLTMRWPKKSPAPFSSRQPIATASPTCPIRRCRVSAA